MSVIDIKTAIRVLTDKNNRIMHGCTPIQQMNALLADEIAELLAKQGEKMRWIPIEERLPEDGQRVDIWVPPYIERIANSVYKKYLYCFTDTRPGAKYLITKDNVTHWMPLPKPPKEGE